MTTWPNGIAKHRIELTLLDIRPLNTAPYRAGPKARELEKTEIDKMHGMNVIESAQSECASLTVLALKREGSLLLCVDY